MSIDVKFVSSLRQRLKENLDRHQRRDHLNKGLTQASVCVIVLDSDALVHGEDPLLEGETAVDRKQLLADIPGIPDDAELTGSVEGTAGRLGEGRVGHGFTRGLPVVPR